MRYAMGRTSGAQAGKSERVMIRWANAQVQRTKFAPATIEDVTPAILEKRILTSEHLNAPRLWTSAPGGGSPHPPPSSPQKTRRRAVRGPPFPVLSTNLRYRPHSNPRGPLTNEPLGALPAESCGSTPSLQTVRRRPKSNREKIFANSKVFPHYFPAPSVRHFSAQLNSLALPSYCHDSQNFFPDPHSHRHRREAHRTRGAVHRRSRRSRRPGSLGGRRD